MKPDMVRKWVLNASPLISLGKAELLKSVSPLAETWIVPGAVIREVSIPAKGVRMKQEPIIYEIVEKWVNDNPQSDASRGLMQLVLSLYSGRDYPFAISTCIKALDQTQRSWAVRLILDYLARGESPELMALGRLYGKIIRPSWWTEEQVKIADRVEEERKRLLQDEEKSR